MHRLSSQSARVLPAAAPLLLSLLLVLPACAGLSGGVAHRPRVTPPGATTTPGQAGLTPTPGPPRYTLLVVAHGFGSPDDLALDDQGRLVFADLSSGSVNRVDPAGQVTALVAGLHDPEGVIAEPDGSFLIAVQGRAGDGLDQILRLPPGGGSPTTFATFTNATGQVGLDGISRDPATGDILVADSPNGRIYRISPDGQRTLLLAAGFVRPTDAIADRTGAVYVADEFGNAILRIAPNGSVATLAHLPSPDDVAFDVDGSLLVTTLGDNRLVRLDPSSGRALGTVARGLAGPQGLVVDPAGNLYVSEQLANVVVELKRA